MLKKSGKICLWLVFLAGFFAAALAQENRNSETSAETEKPYQLEEITVIASPVIEGTSVNSLGSPVTTVSKEQLDDLNAQDVPSALRKTPGVVISRHNPVGSFGGGEGGAIFIRGQGSSRPGAEIQMNIDGIPKFVSVWTHPVMDVLSVDIIDHIDVYKGSQPVLFGNMAFGAVQFHTKRQTEEGFTTAFEGAYGSFDTGWNLWSMAGRSRTLTIIWFRVFADQTGIGMMRTVNCRIISADWVMICQITGMSVCCSTAQTTRHPIPGRTRQTHRKTAYSKPMTISASSPFPTAMNGGKAM
ncbi:MAG: Plug domain-containing protein [Desulfobacterales bacterium]